MFLERALQLLQAFVASWGAARLVAAWREAPLFYLKPMVQSLREIEGLARQAIFELAQTLKVRAFVARGPRPVQAPLPVQMVTLDPMRFRRMMLNPLPRIGAPPLQEWEKPAEEWKVRFCVLGGEPKHRPPVAPGASRQGSPPQSAEPAKRPPEFNEKPAGWKPAVPGGPRKEPPGPKFIGPVRIYQSKHNEAREQAWRDYWLAPYNPDQWVEPAPDVYKSSWPMAKRMEAVRRALAEPLRWARQLARRLARDVAILARAVAKIAKIAFAPSAAPAANPAPADPPDPDQLE